MRTVAALYVQTGGCYFGLPGVDPWDEARDARRYAGPWPAVAHPPCQRWGRMYFGQPLTVKRTGVRQKLGDDGGCFEAALTVVRTSGGVIEHPKGSHAWKFFGLNEPPEEGGWVPDGHGGWTCCVEQGRYGTTPASRPGCWCTASIVRTCRNWIGGRARRNTIRSSSLAWAWSGRSALAK